MAEYDSVIPAGGSGTLKAKVHTSPGLSRKLAKTVAVSTDSPSARQLTLRLSLDVVAPIIMLPRPSLMLVAPVGTQTSDRLLLRRSDGKPLEVNKIDISIPDTFTLETIEVKDEAEEYKRIKAQPGDLWLQATALPQDGNTSRSVQAVLHTNHPEQPKLQVPLILRVREAIEALPTTVQIRVRDGKALGRQVNATIRSNTRERFEITGIEVSHPDVFTAAALTKGEQTAHTLRIQLAQDLDESTLILPFRSRIKASTSAEVKPVVELDLLIAEHRPRRPAPTQVRRPVPRLPTPQIEDPGKS